MVEARSLLLALALIGCGGSEPSASGDGTSGAGPTEVVLWHAYRAREAEALDRVVDDFNRSQSDVRIRAQAIPYDPFVDKVTIAVPRGQGPDLFIFAHDRVGSWVEKGVLEPLSQKVDHAFLAELMPQSVRALVYRKNLYGLPLAFKSLVMFYNKALVPDPPATMEALVPALQAVQGPTNQGVRYGLVYQAGGLYFHAMWIHAFGGSIFGPDHAPTFDTPEQLAALAFARGLYRDAHVLPSGVSGFMVTSLFNEGNAAVVFNGPWFTSEIHGVDWGVRPIPTVHGAAPAPLLAVEAVFITKTSQHKDAALKAALYLAGAASARVRMEVGGQPVCQRTVLAEGAGHDATLRALMQQADHTVLMDSSPEMQLVWTPADQAIAAAIFGDRDPKAELAAAQEKIVEGLAKSDKPR